MIAFLNDLTPLLTSGGAIQHSKLRTVLRSCPAPTRFFTGRHEILSQMHVYFSKEEKHHVFVLYGLGGAGKSQIAFKFIEECQSDMKTNR